MKVAVKNKEVKKEVKTFDDWENEIDDIADALVDKADTVPVK